MPRAHRIVVLALLLLLGCTKAPAFTAAWDLRPAPRVVHPEPAPPPQRTVDPTLAREMHERFDALALIGPHVVRGEVEQAKALAAALLERLDEVESPESWRSRVAALRVEVRALTTAQDLTTIAAASARVAARCGACHEAVHADPQLDDTPMPARGHDERAAMRLHAWGVARLREGLVGPSADRWLQGTATFATLPSCDQPEASRHELCSRVKAIARRAHVAESTEVRVGLYGELLGTCAACHTDSGPR